MGIGKKAATHKGKKVIENATEDIPVVGDLVDNSACLRNSARGAHQTVSRTAQIDAITVHHDVANAQDVIAFSVQPRRFEIDGQVVDLAVIGGALGKGD